MKLFNSIVAISALCVAVGACESNTKFKEDMLSSAGFKPTPPKTPAQIASLKSLPAHKFTKTTLKGRTAWVYADPTICGCLYIGNQTAYDAYARRLTQQRMFDMQTVNVPAEPLGWDFAPWPEASVEP